MGIISYSYLAYGEPQGTLFTEQDANITVMEKRKRDERAVTFALPLFYCPTFC